MRNIIVLFFAIATFNISAQNLITQEQFAACSLPGNWVLLKETGSYNFNITKSSIFPQSDATCSIVYQQLDKSDPALRKFSIVSQEYKLYSYDQYSLIFGLRYTRPTTNGSLKVYSIIDGKRTLLQTYSSDVYQNGQILINQTISLNGMSAVNKIQFSFDYESSGNDYNTLIVIDNISLSGPDNDDCSRAVPLILDKQCLAGNCQGALMTGPKPSCNGNFTQSMWYSFSSPYTGLVKIQTSAVFNDAISVFEGSCQNLKENSCYDNDLYGFEGEKNYFQAEAGKNYFIRVTKQISYYGREDIGDLCISITKASPKYPPHDLCTNSIPLSVGSNCTSGTNREALFEQSIPSLNQKSKADVWYRFTTTNNKTLEIVSHADFADVLTLYSGTCNQLHEVQCEDLGGKLILNNPSPNTSYYIQVSGYFSTIEGNLCVEIKEKESQKPVNDDCVQAKPIIVNQACSSVSSINSLPSAKKASCMVYATPDLWFSFVAPQEKDIALQINAGFLYNYAVYSGNCSNLTEEYCGKNPDPCDGNIILRGLVPGKTYFLQVASSSFPLKSSEADVCISIYELSKAPLFTPLSLVLNYECLHGVLGRVSYQASGGKGQYQYTGPDPNQILLPGSKVDAFITDEAGCRDFESVTIDCQTPSKCKGSNLDLLITSECIVDSIGRQTGEVILHYTGTGGSGAYFYYGTADNSRLKHGDDYQIILIDSDSCYIIEEGRINCPPFDCSQSRLKLEVSYTCVDTLLKAQLHVGVSGNLGNITLRGNQDGEFLDQGAPIQTSVEDQAGCKVEFTDEIKCKFDSCAYARPSLNVDYNCVIDTNGNRTGKAVLHISGNSFAGGLIIKGGKEGDTLSHNDSYEILLTDAFGCSLTKKGIVVCEPVINKDAQTSENLVVYPNPANDLLHIILPQSLIDAATVQIIPSSGLTGQSIKLNPKEPRKQIDLDLRGIPSGLYYIKIEGNSGYDIARFVKTN